MNVIQPSKRLRLKVEWCKKASPAKFGDRVYKVFLDTARLLKARGWAEVKSTRQYAYLRLSEGHSSKSPFFIDVAVPTREEIVQMADDAHREGKEWSGWIGEWPSGYSPSTEQPALVLMDDETRRPVPGQRTTYMSQPEFIVGAMCLIWHAGVSWRDGNARYYEKTEAIVEHDTATHLFGGNIAEDLYEGTLCRIEVNQYERDAAARARCINHHGTTCAICGFDFFEKYGDVASGFIHVHHLLPISKRHGEYKVDAINDLIPVCPNCHSVMHLREPPYDPNELCEFLKGARCG